jgi:hypothetical protein
MTVLIVVLSGLLVWSIGSSAGGSLAREESRVGRQAVVAPVLQYQGRLTDPDTGEPVDDGSYTMAFRLYDVESGGSWLWSETKDVSVQGGVFSTALGDTEALDPGLFNGQALWLGIKVGADDEATPRQPILPVAYALGLAPGAIVSTTSNSAAFVVRNAGAGDALEVDGDLSVSGSLSGGSHDHSGSDITSGTVAEPRIDAQIARDNEIMPSVLGNDGTGSGLDADRLDGYEGSQLFALTENETVSGLPRFYGGTSGSTPPFYVDSNTYVPNLNADYLDGYSASAFALASQVQAPLLKYRSWSEWIDPVQEGTTQYFTNNKLTVTPPTNGYLLITARIHYNCALDVDTQSYFGVYVTTSTSTPTSATGFTDSEIMGFASALESGTGAYGNFNPNIVVTPQYVTGGTTYYIWTGVRGLNVTGLDCAAYNPRIIATFYLSGM